MRTGNVGAAVRRLEDPSILKGRGRYVDDIAFPRMLEAAFVRSSEAHAWIRGIDTEAALALPGVTAVLTLRDLGVEYKTRRMVQSNPHALIKQNITQKPLADAEVCYVGTRSLLTPTLPITWLHGLPGSSVR